MRKESDIIHENATHWVSREPEGHLRVWRSGLTHSTLCATYGKGIPNQVQRAIADADARDGAIKEVRASEVEAQPVLSVYGRRNPPTV